MTAHRKPRVEDAPATRPAALRRQAREDAADARILDVARDGYARGSLDTVSLEDAKAELGLPPSS